ncbi:hypothetical protein H2202_007205 [Exophiala xenobiotica]|nr:hypothetical protein H2202_007205 [Exophiala xenobiotica]
MNMNASVFKKPTSLWSVGEIQSKSDETIRQVSVDATMERTIETVSNAWGLMATISCYFMVGSSGQGKKKGKPSGSNAGQEDHSNSGENIPSRDLEGKARPESKNF